MDPCLPWLSCSAPAQPLRSVCSHFVSSLSMKLSCGNYPPQLHHPRKTLGGSPPASAACGPYRLGCFALGNYTFLTHTTSSPKPPVFGISQCDSLQRFSNTCKICTRRLTAEQSFTPDQLMNASSLEYAARSVPLPAGWSSRNRNVGQFPVCRLLAHYLVRCQAVPKVLFHCARTLRRSDG